MAGEEKRLEQISNLSNRLGNILQSLSAIGGKNEKRLLENEARVLGKKLNDGVSAVADLESLISNFESRVNQQINGEPSSPEAPEDERFVLMDKYQNRVNELKETISGLKLSKEAAGAISNELAGIESEYSPDLSAEKIKDLLGSVKALSGKILAGYSKKGLSEDAGHETGEDRQTAVEASALSSELGFSKTPSLEEIDEIIRDLEKQKSQIKAQKGKKGKRKGANGLNTTLSERIRMLKKLKSVILDTQDGSSKKVGSAEDPGEEQKINFEKLAKAAFRRKQEARINGSSKEELEKLHKEWRVFYDTNVYLDKIVDLQDNLDSLADENIVSGDDKVKIEEMQKMTDKALDSLPNDDYESYRKNLEGIYYDLLDIYKDYAGVTVSEDKLGPSDYLEEQTNQLLEELPKYMRAVLSGIEDASIRRSSVFFCKACLENIKSLGKRDQKKFRGILSSLVKRFSKGEFDSQTLAVEIEELSERIIRKINELEQGGQTAAVPEAGDKVKRLESDNDYMEYLKSTGVEGLADKYLSIITISREKDADKTNKVFIGKANKLVRDHRDGKHNNDVLLEEMDKLLKQVESDSPQKGSVETQAGDGIENNKANKSFEEWLGVIRTLEEDLPYVLKGKKGYATKKRAIKQLDKYLENIGGSGLLKSEEKTDLYSRINKINDYLSGKEKPVSPATPKEFDSEENAGESGSVSRHTFGELVPGEGDEAFGIGGKPGFEAKESSYEYYVAKIKNIENSIISSEEENDFRAKNILLDLGDKVIGYKKLIEESTLLDKTEKAALSSKLTVILEEIEARQEKLGLAIDNAYSTRKEPSVEAPSIDEIAEKVFGQLNSEVGIALGGQDASLSVFEALDAEIGKITKETFRKYQLHLEALEKKFERDNFKTGEELIRGHQTTLNAAYLEISKISGADLLPEQRAELIEKFDELISKIESIVPPGVIEEGKEGLLPAEAEASAIDYSDFEKEFNISLEDLEGIEGFSELTEAKKLLVLVNYKQAIKKEIDKKSIINYRKMMRKKFKSDKKWNQFSSLSEHLEHSKIILTKIWKGMLRPVYLNKEAKKVLEEEKSKGIEGREDVLRGLVDISSRSNVELSEHGSLKFVYVSFENENFNFEEEDKAVISQFNSAADVFSRVPLEWSKPKAKTTDKMQFNNAKKRYQMAKDRLGAVLAARSKKDGDGERVADANDFLIGLEKNLKLNQFLTSNQDVEEQLVRVEESGSWNNVLKTAGAERLGYFVGGTMLRGGAKGVLMFGGATAATFGSMAVSGGAFSYIRAKRDLRENDLLIKSGEMPEKREYVKAEKITNRLERLIEKIETGERDGEKIDNMPAVYKHLDRLLKYCSDKDQKGLLTFGVGDAAANNFINFQDATQRAYVLSASRKMENLEGDARLDKILKLSDADLSAKERKYYAKKIAVGAGFAVGIGAAGFLVRHAISEVCNAYDLNVEAEKMNRWADSLKLGELKNRIIAYQNKLRAINDDLLDTKAENTTLSSAVAQKSEQLENLRTEHNELLHELKALKKGGSRQAGPVQEASSGTSVVEKASGVQQTQSANKTPLNSSEADESLAKGIGLHGVGERPVVDVEGTLVPEALNPKELVDGGSFHSSIVQRGDGVETVLIRQLIKNKERFGCPQEIIDHGKEAIKIWAGRRAHKITSDDGYFKSISEQKGLTDKAIDKVAYVPFKSDQHGIVVAEYQKDASGNFVFRKAHTPNTELETGDNLDFGEYNLDQSHASQALAEANSPIDLSKVKIIDNHTVEYKGQSLELGEGAHHIVVAEKNGHLVVTAENNGANESFVYFEDGKKFLPLDVLKPGDDDNVIDLSGVAESTPSTDAKAINLVGSASPNEQDIMSDSQAQKMINEIGLSESSAKSLGVNLEDGIDSSENEILKTAHEISTLHSNIANSIRNAPSAWRTLLGHLRSYTDVNKAMQNDDLLKELSDYAENSKPILPQNSMFDYLKSRYGDTSERFFSINRLLKLEGKGKLLPLESPKKPLIIENAYGIKGSRIIMHKGKIGATGPGWSYKMSFFGFGGSPKLPIDNSVLSNLQSEMLKMSSSAADDADIGR